MLTSDRHPAQWIIWHVPEMQSPPPQHSALLLHEPPW
jgi:hypothetical protein